MSPIFLTIVIPAYNEALRLGKTLDAVTAFLKKHPYASEIIVSDDGSTDATVRVAEERLRGFEYRILSTPRNKGKGHAVRQGMLAASGEYLFFTDADLSTPIEEIARFLPLLEKDADVVIGSRALPGSRIEIRQNPLREAMGKIFNRIARLTAFTAVRDSQCGFKGFRREAALKLFAAQKLDGFSFDAEIVYLAQKKGLRLRELPVIWRNSPQSRVHILLDPIRMFLDILKIRRLHT